MTDGQEDRQIKAQSYGLLTVQSVAWDWGCWWGLDCPAGVEQGERWECKGLMMRRSQNKEGNW